MAGKIKKGGKPQKPMSPEEFVARFRENQAYRNVKDAYEKASSDRERLGKKPARKNGLIDAETWDAHAKAVRNQKSSKMVLDRIESNRKKRGSGSTARARSTSKRGANQY